MSDIISINGNDNNSNLLINSNNSKINNKINDKIKLDLEGRIYQDGTIGYYYVYRRVDDILYMYEYTGKEKIPIERWPVLEPSTNLGKAEILKTITIAELQTYTLIPERMDPQRDSIIERFALLTFEAINNGYNIFGPWTNVENIIEEDIMISSWNKFVYYNSNNESYEIVLDPLNIVQSFRIYDLTLEDFPLD